MNRAIVTGANGFLGSHILYRLLQQGWHVHALGRSTEKAPLVDRVTNAVLELGPRTDLRGELECHEANLEQFTVPAALRSNRNGTAASTVLIHVAGDTRFWPPDPAAQRRTNVDSAVSVIRELHGHIGLVVHISTCFVAGDRPGVVRESDLDRGQGFRNAYEKSKFEAEVAITDFCRTHDLPLVIIRPSVVTNDRRTGRASTFTHLNALVEVVSRVQRHFRITDGEVVSPTIRLLADPDAWLNLAPIDSVVPLLLRIMMSPDAPGRTYHVCHPSPETNSQLISVMAEALLIHDKIGLEFLSEIPKPLTRTEELIVGALEQYVPYLNSRTQFDMSHVRAIVPEYESYFTPVDPAYIRKILESQRAVKAQRMKECQAASQSVSS